MVTVDRLYQHGYRLAYPLAILWQRLARRVTGTGIAVWHGGEVLLVWHSYRPGWSLPGGWIKRGERPAECACRELAEEVGVVAAPEELRPVPPVARGQHLFEYHPAQRPTIAVDNREILRGAFRSPADAADLTADTRLYLRRWWSDPDASGPQASAESAHRINQRGGSLQPTAGNHPSASNHR